VPLDTAPAGFFFAFGAVKWPELLLIDPFDMDPPDACPFDIWPFDI